ncbi:hypothetical protein Tco_0848901 [Tanacetum coccineum]
MMWACPKKISESVQCLIKSFIKSLLKSRDFISKICCFRRREEFVDEFRNKIIPCKNRSRGFFFKPNPGGTLEGKWEKHKLYRRTRDVRELHRRSDLVEITDVSMRVFFVMFEELFVLNEGNHSVLKLKVVSGDLGNNDGILVTHGAISPAFPPDHPAPSGLVIFLSYSAMASATRLATSLSTTLHLNRLGRMVLSTTQVRNLIRIRMISD